MLSLIIKPLIDRYLPMLSPRHHTMKVIFLILLTLTNLSPAAAMDAEPLERILESARSFLTATLAQDREIETHIEIGRLDSRLQLRSCDHVPTAKMAPGGRTSGNTTVKVSCSSPVSWSIFVPVTIERYTKALVVAHPLSRGHQIQPADLRLERTEISMLSRGYFSDLQAALGLQTRRALTPGQVLLPVHLSQPELVERGQLVTLYSARPGLVVRMTGIALEDGKEGQRIRVRNQSSKRIVEGVVDASGGVRIDM